MSQLTKDEALAKLRSRATTFMVLTVVFFVVTILALIITAPMSYYAPLYLWIAGGLGAILTLSNAVYWFFSSSLYLHAAATK